MFEMNRQSEKRLQLIGAEKTPLLTIDEAFTCPEELCASARIATFERGLTGVGYPGKRASLPTEYVERLKVQLFPIIRHVYNIPNIYTPIIHNAVFSIVDYEKEELGIYQRLPHADTSKPYYFAILHYVNRGKFGGTAFYRHQPSTFENIHPNRVHIFEQSINQYIEQNGEPQKEFFTQSSPLFEEFHQVEFLQNRLIVYPGSLLHNGLITHDTSTLNTTDNGRLTANIFVEFCA